jgi:Zn-finger nucleic acid-binding protein
MDRMPCPACGSDLIRSTIGGGGGGGDALNECPTCHGTWLDIDTFQTLTADPDRQTAVLAKLRTRDPDPATHAVTLPCPRCRRPMQRHDYAGASGVHVDVCREHGIWFDRDELRRIVEFIRSGGLNRRRDRHGEGAPARTPLDVERLDVWDLLDFLLMFW